MLYQRGPLMRGFTWWDFATTTLSATGWAFVIYVMAHQSQAVGAFVLTPFDMFYNIGPFEFLYGMVVWLCAFVWNTVVWVLTTVSVGYLAGGWLSPWEVEETLEPPLTAPTGDPTRNG